LPGSSLQHRRKRSRHEAGSDPTYNNTTCFETFPFSWPPGQELTAHPAYIAISAAAKQLHEERDTIARRRKTSMNTRLSAGKTTGNMELPPQ
jgi:hypothetical protein